MVEGLKRFRDEFRQWVVAYNSKTGSAFSPDKVLERLKSRIPVDRLSQIGEALNYGWLQTNKGYFVRESDNATQWKGMYMFEQSNGDINPCWEQFIQLADYRRLKEVAKQHGSTIRLEDKLMDITVYAGKDLLLYVENKVKEKDMLNLLSKMQEYGEKGFNVDDPDKGNSALRKAKYLVHQGAFPKYFALSAAEVEKVFEVDYLYKNNRFNLHELQCSITDVLHINKPENTTPPSRSKVDLLARELQHNAGNMAWVLPGTGQIAYNFYISTYNGAAIIVGLYQDGSIWSHLVKLDDKKVDRLRNVLSELNMDLELTKEHSFWKKDGRKYHLKEEDIPEIARQVISIL